MFRFPSPNRNRDILFYSFEHLKKKIRLIVFPLFWCLVLSYRYECMLFFVHMGNFSPVDRDEKTKIVEQKLVSFGTVVQLCRLFSVTTTEVEKHTRQISCYFCLYVAIAKIFCQKLFLLGHPGWSVHME